MTRKKSLSSFSKNKKGDISLDTLFMVVMVIVVGLAWFFMGFAFDSISEDLTDSLTTTEAKEGLADVQEDYNQNFDGLIAFLFFGSAIFVIISSWFLDSHPVFFVATLIIFSLLIGAVVILANAAGVVVEDPAFASTAADFNLMVFIFSHLVELVVGVGFISSVVLYGKFKAGF